MEMSPSLFYQQPSTSLGNPRETDMDSSFRVSRRLCDRSRVQTPCDSCLLLIRRSWKYLVPKRWDLAKAKEEEARRGTPRESEQEQGNGGLATAPVFEKLLSIPVGFPPCPSKAALNPEISLPNRLVRKPLCRQPGGAWECCGCCVGLLLRSSQTVPRNSPQGSPS